MASTTKTLLPKNDDSLLSHHHLLTKKQVNEYVTFEPNPSQDLDTDARTNKMVQIESIDQLHRQSMSQIRASQVISPHFMSPNSSQDYQKWAAQTAESFASLGSCKKNYECMGIREFRLRES